jgi:hypothetical protein
VGRGPGTCVRGRRGGVPGRRGAGDARPRTSRRGPRAKGAGDARPRASGRGMVYRYIGVWVYGCIGVRVYGCTGVRAYRCTGVSSFETHFVLIPIHSMFLE